MILAAVVLLGSAAWAQWPAGVPEKLRQLKDLKRVVGPESRLSPEQRTLVLLEWLARERRQPSPSTKGLGGFPITSGYIQAQILQVLSGTADPVLIETLAGSPQVRDAGIRDAMRLSLGLMRDARQIPALTSILQKHPEPYFRWRAAQALGALGATEAAPALRRALSDSFSVRSEGGVRSKRGDVVYPVRDLARAALDLLRDRKALAETRKGRERFTHRLHAARTARASGHGIPLIEALEVVNAR